MSKEEIYLEVLAIREGCRDIVIFDALTVLKNRIKKDIDEVVDDGK